MKYLLVVLIILFASFTDIFLFRIGIIPVQPSDFLVPLFLVASAIKYNILDLIDITKSHTFRFFAAILFLTIIYSAISPAPSDTIVKDILLNIFTLIMYVFLVQFFRTENKKLVFFVLLGAFIVLALSVWYDYFVGLPKFTKALESMARKGGFGENPNQAASAMKFLALCVLVFVQHLKRSRSAFLIVMIMSVFMTFSRSGIISVILILILGTANSWSTKFNISPLNLFKSSFRMIFIFLILYFGLLFYAGFIKRELPDLAKSGMADRIDLLTGQSKKSIIAEDVGSGGGRGDLAFLFYDKFVQNPLGYGTAYTSHQHSTKLNTHNYYLMLAVNLGFLALFFYLFYLYVGVRISFKSNHFYYLIFVILLMFEGLISHYIFYNRSMLICLAFFDGLIYRKKVNQIS